MKNKKLNNTIAVKVRNEIFAEYELGKLDPDLLRALIDQALKLKACPVCGGKVK